MQNEIKFDGPCLVWTQIAQNRRHEERCRRTIGLPMASDRDSLYAAVSSFAEFVAESGGDIRTSVLAAMDDLQRAAALWTTKVDTGRSEAEIEFAGEQLKKITELYKASESYYFTEYEYAGTGTEGD